MYETEAVINLSIANINDKVHNKYLKSLIKVEITQTNRRRLESKSPDSFPKLG